MFSEGFNQSKPTLFYMVIKSTSLVLDDLISGVISTINPTCARRGEFL